MNREKGRIPFPVFPDQPSAFGEQPFEMHVKIIEKERRDFSVFRPEKGNRRSDFFQNPDFL